VPVIIAIQDFIEQGGPVLWVIFVACLLLWALILERIWFIRITWPRRARGFAREWDGREDCQSWRAKKIREATISQGSMQLHVWLPLIQMLVALCPLLGLLGHGARGVPGDDPHHVRPGGGADRDIFHRAPAPPG
jgi:biopolymer transport protein ExbB